MLDIVVCHAAAIGFLVDLLVCWVGIFGDDVPGVDETGEEAQAAESDVDEGVGRAETALDPYCELSATDSSRVHISQLGPCCTVGCATCGEGKRGRHSPAMGGKRMAKKPRKMSLPHMLFVWYRSEAMNS